MESRIPFSQLFRTHQSASVVGGNKDRVFYGKIPDSCQGFIKRLATTVWYPDVTYVVKVDGAVFETLDRNVGLTEPLVFDGDSQILVRDNVEVLDQNSSTNTYNLGFQVDGSAYHTESMLAEMRYGKK